MVKATLLPKEEGVGFSLKNQLYGEYNVSVDFSGNVSAQAWELIFNSSLFQEWLTSYTLADRLRLKNITFQNAEMSSNLDPKEKITSLEMIVEAIDKDNDLVKGPVNLRPLSRGVLLLLRNTQTRVDSCIFVKKRNLASGLLDCLEIPQGQFDSQGKFIGAAAELIEENLNLKIMKKDLINLTTVAFGSDCRGVSTSATQYDKPIPKTCDYADRTELYLYRCNMTQEAITELENKIGRSRRHGKPSMSPGTMKKEGLQLSLVQLGDAWHATADARSIAALFLVHELRYHRLMPKFKNVMLEDAYTQNGDRRTDAPMKTASYMRVSDLQPQMKGINLRLKAYSSTVQERERIIQNGKTIREGTIVVGDGDAIITARLVDQQLDLPIHVGSPILIRNGQIRMDDGHMRLFVDRWGKISTDIPEGEEANFNFIVNPEKDMSATEYELVLQFDNQENEDEGVQQSGNSGRSRKRGGGSRGRGIKRG